MQSIGAVTMWIRSNVRRDWRGLTSIAFGIAIAGGLAMTAAIGATRAGSAWQQLLTRTNMPDVAKEALTTESAGELDTLRSHHGVTSAARMSFMVIGLEGQQPVGGFTGRDPAFGTEIYRPIVQAGRLADPTRADELTINPSMAEMTGLRPGAHVVLVSYPDAVHQPATVVGITVGSLDLGLNGDQPLALLTPAFGAAWFDTYFAALPPDTQAGYRDVMLAQVRSADTSEELLRENYTSGTDFAGHEVVAALDAEGTAYAVLAAVAALGTAIAFGQLIGRRVRRRADQAPTLSALGLTPIGRRAALAGEHVLASIAGVVMVPVVAYLASPLTGRGLIGRVDPNGRHVTDIAVMVGGGLLALIALVGAPIVAAWRADSRTLGNSTRTTRLRLPGPAGLFGGRVAAGWTGRSGPIAARSHVAVVALGVAAVAAALTWSAAARHVVATPASYGATWDAAVLPVDDGSSTVDPVAALDSAQTDLEVQPGIEVLGRGVAGIVGETRIEVLEIDPAAGSWWPPLVDGRVPQNRDEITAGSGLFDGRTHLGDAVSLDGRSFTVVGEHVSTPWSNGEFGVTVATLSGAVPVDHLDAPNAVMWLSIGTGASIEHVRTTVDEAYEVRSPSDARPSDVTNLSRIGGLDELLLSVCVLLAIATLVNGIVLATGARQGDHAIMSSLGAQRSTIAGTVAWHTVVVAVVSGLVGVPLGVLAGAAVWRQTARVVFVGSSLHHPVLMAFEVAAGLAATSLVVAAATGTAAARRSHPRQQQE